MLKNLIRGGQTHIHGVRMAMQIVRFALLTSILCGIGIFSFKCYRTIPNNNWQQVFEYYVAEIQVSMLHDNKNAAEQNYYPINGGKPYKTKSIKILNDRKVKQIVRKTERLMQINSIYALKMTSLVIGMIFVFWFLKGSLSKRKSHKRGTSYLSPWKLKWKLILTGQASRFKLGSLTLVKNSETSHILVCGTTGSGKSNCFNLLMPQIRKKGQRAIIFDPTGEFVAKYYREGKDYILNPFDKRAVGWNIWDEYEHDYELDTIAATFIQGGQNNNDPFWVESARNLFIQAVILYQELGIKSNQELVHFLLNSSLKELRIMLGSTNIRSLLEEGAEKTLISVRSTLMNYIKPLNYINDKLESFSIKKWIHDEKEDSDSWLFLSCRADQRETLKPLISSWLDISINSLMSSKIDTNRRFWFIIDELPALQRIASLKTALAESRKYGGCIVAGLQSLNQMHALYGQDHARSMLNLFNTEVYFRTIESSNRELISGALGEAEESELMESISYGANTMRDGVSNSVQTRNRRLVTATELRHLEDLEAIIQLPQINNITKVKMPFAKQKNLTQGFIGCDEKMSITNFNRASNESQNNDDKNTEIFDGEEPMFKENSKKQKNKNNEELELEF